MQRALESKGSNSLAQSILQSFNTLPLVQDILGCRDFYFEVEPHWANHKNRILDV